MKCIGFRGLLPLVIIVLVAASCGDSSPWSSEPGSSEPGSSDAASGGARKAGRAVRNPKPKARPAAARSGSRGQAGGGPAAPDSLVDILPENTVFLVHCPDLGRTRSALADTTLADIVREEAFTRLLAVPFDTLTRALDRFREDRGVDVVSMFKALKGEAVLGVTLDGAEPGVILGLDLGDGFLAAHQLVRELGKDRTRMQKVHGVDVFSLRMSPRTGHELHVCFHHGRLLAASRSSLLTAALEGPGTPLTGREVYGRAVTQTLGEAADLRVFLDLEPLIRLAESRGGPEARRALGALGLDQLTAVSMATAVDSPLFRERLVVLGKGGLPLVDQLLVNHAVDQEMLKRVPRTVESFVAGRLELETLPARVNRLVAEIDDPSATTMTAGLKQAERGLGMPLEAFLAAVGDRMAYMKMPDASATSLEELMRNPLAGAVLLVRLHDARKVEEALDRLSQLPGGLQRDPFGGKTGYRFSARGPMPVEARVVLDDGWLVAAADEDTLDRYLGRPRGSVMDSPTFQIRLRGMPEKVAAVSFTDLRPSVHHMMEIAQGMLPVLGQTLDGEQGLPFEWQRLPDPEVINRHLTPVTSFVQRIPDGLAMESVSPVGTLSMVVPAFVIGLAPSLVDAATPRSTAARRGPAWLRLLSDGQPTGRVGGGAKKPPSRWSRTSQARRLQSTPEKDEKAMLYLLRSLVDAQAMFKKACAVDVNGNGVGEYATFAELAGTVPLRETQRALDPPILTTAFGRVQKGQLRRSGYYLRLYLPGAAGKPLGERSSGGAPTGVEAERAEQAWCVVAWPLAARKGARSFYADQSGQIRQTVHPYHGDQAPDPEQLLQVMTATPAGYQLRDDGKDGSQWTPAK